MYGITINGSVGWIVGKDSDVLLFPDKGTASAELKNSDTSWHCEAVSAEFPGWGMK